MIKLAIALSLMLGACTADRALDAKVLRTYARSGVLQVWIPEHEDTYTVNVEDFAGGAVSESALTCPALVDMSRMDPSLRYYFPPFPGDLSESVGGAETDGIHAWTMKGCEGLNEFADHDAHPDAWLVPKVDRDPSLAWAHDSLTAYCSATCDAYGDCDVCD